jgi:hypothetical protein
MVLMSNSATSFAFVAAITDIRCPVKAGASFPDKVLAVLVAGRAGSTFNTANNELITGIGFLTVEAMDAEVLCIKEKAFPGVIV